MDQRLLAYYGRELQYLREVGGEFARQFPKIAGRLGIDAFECADPYVERLLEGFAFLTARVQLKIDSEFPRFSEHLLELVYPHYLAPTPSMAVVELKPDFRQAVLNEGLGVPKGTVLRGNIPKGDQTGCEYRTAHDLTLWPIELTALTHGSHLGDLGAIRLAERREPKGAVRLRLEAPNGVPFQRMGLTRLPLFVRAPDQLAMRLYELLLGGAIGLVMKEPGGNWREIVPDRPLSSVGFEDDQALLPYGLKSFHGYRLLHEYFALPARYLFIELGELARGVQRCEGPVLEIAILLDRHDASVETAIGPSHLVPFCTPVVNLFPKRADRIQLSDREHEYHVVADRTRPMDFEVHSITEMLGIGGSSEVQREFRPFFGGTERTLLDEDAAYYTVHREQRGPSSRQRIHGPRSSYIGSETFVQLVDGKEGPYRSDLRQLSVNTLCTNRDLPLRMPVGEGRTDFVLESGAPVESTRCVAGPSPPRPSHAWGGVTWRLISHLSLNYLSISARSGEEGAAALREMLLLYGDLTDPPIRRQIDGVRTVSSSPIVRRLPMPGPAAFARGLEIQIQCDETAFEGRSVFLLGAVLERFFSKYVGINSFTETLLRSLQRGEIMRWPARIGRRPAL